MSTPRISFKVPGHNEVEGDVTVHETSAAPGKEREREPLYGGEIANISESMDVDNDGGELGYT
jgi:SWI/SNF related-matrix-associated actin-dependent regulator of chromatin subfamily C